MPRSRTVSIWHLKRREQVPCGAGLHPALPGGQGEKSQKAERADTDAVAGIWRRDRGRYADATGGVIGNH